MLSCRFGKQIWLALDLQCRQLVVLKILVWGAEFTWEDLWRFEREAQVLQSLHHASIPCYLDQFELNDLERNGFVFVQAYIPACSLDIHLKRGRVFSESDFYEIAAKLLQILTYLHGLYPSVVHCDIQPSNVLISEDLRSSLGSVYLIDFASVQTATIGVDHGVVGTEGYMPPELYQGVAVPASDLYSLGMTLICLATGCDLIDSSPKNLWLRFESSVNLPPSLNEWLQKMTAPDLQKRFKSAIEAQQQLKAAETACSSTLQAVSLQSLSLPSLTRPSLLLVIFSLSSLVAPALVYLVHLTAGISIVYGLSIAKLLVVPYGLLEVFVLSRNYPLEQRSDYLVRSFSFAALAVLMTQLLTYLFF
ncbi:serine/threonine protein kinase [Leptolyngbya sp. AN10]